MLAKSAISVQLKGSDYIAAFLESRKVKSVFELTGGMITHLLDSISRRGNIRIVSVHHEQAAAFAADAIGRLTGTPGVAFATSGPGATNLLTGIGSCYFDSSPAVFITGQVNRNEQKGNRAIRQLGFQETDIVSMARPITKAAWLVQTPEELPSILSEGFELAVSGRPGPVLIDVPMDVQRLVTDFPELPEYQPVRRHAQFGRGDCTDLLSQLRAASRPLILVGGGARSFRELVKKFAETVRVPVVTSLLARDAIPYSDRLQFGMIGSYGNRWANLALGMSDFLVVLGSRLDVRQTGSDTTGFSQGRTIFHVDCEAAEMNNRVQGCHTIESNLGDFLEGALRCAAEADFWPDRSAWLGELDALRSQWPDTKELEGTPGINPNSLMHSLSQHFPHASTYTVDVGQHQMWAAQSLEIGPEQRFLTSGGMGSMGFALPAAIGAATLDPDKPVISIAGDGGFQCNLQELQTVIRNRFPIKMVVIDNGCHGMVRQFQESYFEKNYQSTLWGYDAPNFAHVATAYGIPSRVVSEPDDVPAALDWLRNSGPGPALLHVRIDTFSNAYPKLAFGRPITEMEPMATPLEQEGT